MNGKNNMLENTAYMKKYYEIRCQYRNKEKAKEIFLAYDRTHTEEQYDDTEFVLEYCKNKFSKEK